MIVYLNGQFVPEERATVSVFDRAFLYGDGLFETMRLVRGAPFRWAQHHARLEHGAAALGLRLPAASAQLLAAATETARCNGLVEGLLRLTLSRGTGPRGYSPAGADQPVLVMTCHPLPPGVDRLLGWTVAIASIRLPAGDALAAWKTCNKLPQVMARAEAERSGAHEALLLNTRDEVVEAASANLFWVRQGRVETPPLASGVLPGVTRATVFELCAKLGIPQREAIIQPGDLLAAEGVFLSLSSYGLVEVLHLDRRPLNRSPIVQSLWQAYQDLLAA